MVSWFLSEFLYGRKSNKGGRTKWCTNFETIPGSPGPKLNALFTKPLLFPKPQSLEWSWITAQLHRTVDTFPNSSVVPALGAIRLINHIPTTGRDYKLSVATPTQLISSLAPKLTRSSHMTSFHQRQKDLISMIATRWSYWDTPAPLWLQNLVVCSWYWNHYPGSAGLLSLSPFRCSGFGGQESRGFW